MKKMRNFVILLGFIILFMIIVPATAAEIKTINAGTTVFIGERAALNVTTSENPYKDIRKPFPPSDPNTKPYVSGGNQISISDFPRFLAKWNDKMHWGFSPEQIENFSRKLEDGVLKKYKTNPNYPSLEIPDLKPFCLEVGDAIGLSKKQSEVFAIAADEELIKDKIEFNKPLLPEPGAKALTEPGTQSAPFAYGNVDYECIFVDFTIPSPVKPGYQFSWTAADRSDVMNDFAIGTQAISNQAPQQASMSNLRYYWPVVTIDGINPGRGEESTSPNGWMENAIRNLGYEDLNGDGRVSDEFARYWKAYEGADSVVIVYFTHDAMGAYAAGPSKGFADKAVVSYWGYNGEFFDAVPGSYEHEIVHLFGALDETLGSSTCGEYSWFAVSPMKEMYKNTNHENCAGWTNSVMRHYWLTNIISSSSKKFIGWGDFDTDGTLDPLDNLPWGNNVRIGVYRNGEWHRDFNGDGSYPGVTSTFPFVATGWTPIVGDWNYDGKTKIGVTNGATWYLDWNNNGIYDGSVIDRAASFGQSGYKPVIGDWNGTGKAKIGVEKDGSWLIDYNGNYVWDGSGTDRFAGLGQTGDKPVVGDWNADGRTKIGSQKDGFWAIDYNGNYVWDGVVIDRFAGFGQTGDVPVVGDWNADGRIEIGSFKDGFWAIDYNGNYVWDDAVIDRFAGFGQTGDIPVAGDWNQNGKTKIGVYRNGLWLLDYNGNYVWDGAVIDKSYSFPGVTGWTPVVGKWN